jgi:putative YphP/YqiW family bacilliredoxin
MPYPEMMVAPMRQDLVRIGFTELKTPEEVDTILGSEKRTTLVAVNSVCGCAAAMMRPAVFLSLQGEHKPEVLTTVRSSKMESSPTSCSATRSKDGTPRTSRPISEPPTRSIAEVALAG